MTINNTVEMRKVYQSKISIWIVAIMAAAFTVGLYGAYMAHDYINLGVLAFITLFVIYLFATTRYIVNGNLLQVKSGFIVNKKKIEITTISKIEETYNPVSSPAASLDRLEVTYTGGSVIISPKDKRGFVAHMQSIKPDIVFKPRNSKDTYNV